MSAGADPGRVIDRMAARIGELVKQTIIAEELVASQDEEIAQLKAQLTNQSE